MTPPHSLLARILREPTLHFAAVAALLFAGTAIVKSRAVDVIEIDREEVEYRIRQIERGRGTPLTAAERELAASAYVDEHVLARTARSRGLDDDERIRGILYQKMLQVLSDSDVQPTEEQLRAYYEHNRARYRRPDGDATEQPELESIRSMVRFDWLAEHEETILNARIAALREEFAVRIIEKR